MPEREEMKAATLYVYNFDETEPPVEQREEEHESTSAFLIDHDFKWIYSLLKPDNGVKLHRLAAGYPPAPIWIRSDGGLRAITVSTCFPGRT